jgi:hypothetical protein
MGAGGTWRAVFHKHVLIALTGVEAEISACASVMTVSHAIAIAIKIFRIDINAAEVFDCREQGQRFFRG